MIRIRHSALFYLPGQDSNLEWEYQKLLCCLLHHRVTVVFWNHRAQIAKTHSAVFGSFLCGRRSASFSSAHKSRVAGVASSGGLNRRPQPHLPIPLYQKAQGMPLADERRRCKTAYITMRNRVVKPGRIIFSFSAPVGGRRPLAIRPGEGEKYSQLLRHRRLGWSLVCEDPTHLSYIYEQKAKVG